MPTYEYRCSQCKHALEAFQKITEAPLKVCPKCGHETLRRGPGGGIGLSFQGSGFYKTDYPSARPIETSAPDSNTKPPGCCPCGNSKSDCKSS